MTVFVFVFVLTVEVLTLAVLAVVEPTAPGALAFRPFDPDEAQDASYLAASARIR